MRKFDFKKIVYTLLAVTMLFTAIPDVQIKVSAVSNTAQAVFGKELKAENLSFKIGDTNKVIVGEKNGVDAWVLNPALGNVTRYLYVDVNDSIAKNVTDGTNFAVEIEYYDQEDSSLAIEYGQYAVNNVLKKPSYGTTNEESKYIKEGEILDFTGTNTWKKHTWYFDCASMRNQLNGYDFRIGVYSDTMGFAKGGAIYIKSMKVTRLDTKNNVGIKFLSESMGHIFYTDENININFEFNPKKIERMGDVNGRYDADVTYRLIDRNGSVVDEKKEKISLDPDKITRTSHSFKPDKYDCYTIRVIVENKEKKIYSEDWEMCSYVRSTKGERQNLKIGTSVPNFMNSYINPWQADQYAKTLQYAGFSYFRTHYSAPFMAGAKDLLNNPYGTLIIPVNHAGIQSLLGRNIKMLAYIGIGQNERDWNPEHAAPVTEKGFKRWNLIDETYIKQYGKSTYIFETANEPNFLQPVTDQHNADVIAAMVKQQYPRLKAINPDMKIFGPQIMITGNGYGWVENFLAAGGHNYLDGFSIHPYNWNLDPIKGDQWDNPNAASAFYSGTLYDWGELLEKYNVRDMEMMISEYGYSAYNDICPNEWMQACYDITQSLQFLRNGFADVLIPFRYDNMHVNKRTEREHNFGFIRSINENARKYKGWAAAKPVYLAFSNFNYEMYDAEFKDFTKKNEHTYAYLFDKTQEKNQIMYLVTNSIRDTVSFDLGTNKVEMYDMYGNMTELTSTDGRYTFAVSEEPHMIKGNFTKWECIEHSSVMMNTSLIQAGYNSEYKIGILNSTDRSLKVEVKTLPNSQLNVVVPEMVGGEEFISITTGESAPNGVEPIMVTLSDAEGIKYSGTIAISYQDPVSSVITSKLQNDGTWIAIVNLKNETTEPVSGTLMLSTPEELANKVEPKTVTVGVDETLLVELILPEGCEAYAGQEMQFAFMTDIEKNQGSYMTKVFNFNAARKTSEAGLKIDANLEEWQNERWIEFNRTDQWDNSQGYANIYKGLDDISGKFTTMWDEENFYIAADIKDDAHWSQGDNESMIWAYDTFQFGIMYDPNDTAQSNTFVEICASLWNGTPTHYRHKNILDGLENPTKVEGAQIAIVREGDNTRYELAFPWKSLFGNTLPKLEGGVEFKFSVVMSENDTSEQKGAYIFGDGIKRTKNLTLFNTVTLAD